MTTSTIQAPFHPGRFVTRQEALNSIHQAYRQDREIQSYVEVDINDWTRENVEDFNSILEGFRETLWDRWNVDAFSALGDLIDNFVEGLYVIPVEDLYGEL